MGEEDELLRDETVLVCPPMQTHSIVQMDSLQFCDKVIFIVTDFVLTSNFN